MHKNTYIGSYMSALVLLSLLKRSNVRLISILSLFPNEFNIFNNTGARILGSVYQMAFKKNCIHGFRCENVSRSCHTYAMLLPENM